jgi:hypothetical protein
MMNYKNMSDVELLAEKSYMEQLGYAGEVQLMEINEELAKRFEERRNARDNMEINVTFEEGYRWSVDINGGESVDTGLTKADAMHLARTIKADYPNAKINEQKLSRDERKQNISNLHQNGYSYTKF